MKKNGRHVLEDAVPTVKNTPDNVTSNCTKKIRTGFLQTPKISVK
jgi:hypothetical protein